MKLALKAAVIAAALSLPAAAVAHHGWSSYEPEKNTVLEGSIDAVRYANPHAEIDMTVGGQKWLITLAPLSRMETRGVTEAVLKVGQKVKVEGKRSLTPSRFEIKCEQITINGKTTPLRA
ncbi:MAG: DUF6152 family protein [Caulobacteraceae bacterium]